MAFGYPYSYQQPYYPQPVPTPAPRQEQNSGLIWVQGEAGAKSYLVAPGQSVILMDSENSCFYIKSADSSGVPLPLRAFDYTERRSEPPVRPPESVSPAGNQITREEFDALKQRVEAMLSEKEGNHEQSDL